MIDFSKVKCVSIKFDGFELEPILVDLASNTHYAIKENTMEFEVGDRVVVKQEYDLARPGMIGTIATINANNEGNSCYGVAFDKFMSGHNLGGKCEHGYGQWVPAENLAFLKTLPSVRYSSSVEIPQFYTKDYRVGDEVEIVRDIFSHDLKKGDLGTITNINDNIIQIVLAYASGGFRMVSINKKDVKKVPNKHVQPTHYNCATSISATGFDELTRAICDLEDKGYKRNKKRIAALSEKYKTKGRNKIAHFKL